MRLGHARSFATGRRYFLRKSSHLHWDRVSAGHGSVRISSAPLNWETRFETQTYRRTSASTSSRVASPSSSHGRLRSVPVHRYRTPLGWWRSTLVSDALLRPTPPKGRRPSMGTIPHRYWTASRGVSIEPRRQWHALYRSTRSRGPRDRAGSRKEHAVPDSVGASVGTTPHSERPRTSSRIFITKSLMIYWHDTIPSSVPPPALIDGDRGPHSAPLSSEEFSCCRSGASLDDLCSVPLCTTTRRSCVVRRHIHPSNVVVVARCRMHLGVARHFVVDNVHSYPIVTYMLLAISFSVSSNRFGLSSGFVIPDNTNSLMFDFIRYICFMCRCLIWHGLVEFSINGLWS